MSELMIQVQKAKNGYIMQGANKYGTSGDPEIFTDFGDAVCYLAEKLGETGFAATVKQAQVMAGAMSAICTIAVAPKLGAIEARINPGVENIVKDDITF